jgi:uncharacterized RDD family membrane protein YckC
MTEQQMLRSDTSDSSQSSDDLWRTEIQARLERYRTRRGRRIEGSYSMRFPFAPEEGQAKSPSASANAVAEPEENIVDPPLDVQFAPPEMDESVFVETPAPKLDLPGISATTVTESIEEPAEVAIHAAEPEAETSASDARCELSPDSRTSDFELESDLEPMAPPAPRPQSKRKIIAFPRQATNQEETYRLADPIVPDQPRILDVPEELEPFPTTPLLEGLHLPAIQQSAIPSRDHIELPFRAVSISRRLCAGLVDFGIVAAASAVFGAIAYKLLAGVQLTKPLVLAAAIVPVLLWAVYQYVMIMYAGTTAGMLVAKVRLSTFKGDAPNRRHRRSRVIGLYFSTASLMMGLLWSLVDVDALCWHDRISHTYLTGQE